MSVELRSHLLYVLIQAGSDGVTNDELKAEFEEVFDDLTAIITSLLGMDKVELMYQDGTIAYKWIGESDEVVIDLNPMLTPLEGTVGYQSRPRKRPQNGKNVRNAQ